MSDRVAPVERLVKLVSSDNETFLVPREMCTMSKTLNTILTDLGLDDVEGTNADAIPVNNVDGETLKKVISWCTYHLTEPTPAVNNDNNRTELCQWDRAFFNVDQTTVFQIILAANFLDIQELLDGGCKTIAGMMKGKTTEQIREQFQIANDFTPEEEEEMRNENAWCF